MFPMSASACLWVEIIMIIGVDARPVSYPQLTGIGVYLNNLLQALQELDRENHYYLISNGAIHFEVVNQRWIKIEGRLPQRKLSTLWVQCCIPRIASAVKLDLFFGTTPSVAALYIEKHQNGFDRS